MSRPPQSDVTREFGRRVRDRREALGMSQEELGEASQLHRTYIGRVERGEVNVGLWNLVLLATALGVDSGELTSGLTGHRGGTRRGRR